MEPEVDPVHEPMELLFYDIQNAGVTADRPLPVPAAVAEYFPAVGRAEMIWSQPQHISTDMKPTDFEGHAVFRCGQVDGGDRP